MENNSFRKEYGNGETNSEFARNKKNERKIQPASNKIVFLSNFKTKSRYKIIGRKSTI
jgi:hypothetical protein